VDGRMPGENALSRKVESDQCWPACAELSL